MKKTFQSIKKKNPCVKAMPQGSPRPSRGQGESGHFLCKLSALSFLPDPSPKQIIPDPGKSSGSVYLDYIIFLLFATLHFVGATRVRFTLVASTPAATGWPAPAWSGSSTSGRSVTFHLPCSALAHFLSASCQATAWCNSLQLMLLQDRDLETAPTIYIILLGAAHTT